MPTSCIASVLEHQQIPHIVIATPVVPGVPFDKADVSSLTVGFEFEFVSPKSHKAFASAFGKNFPSWPIGIVSSKHNSNKGHGYDAWHITGDESIHTNTARYEWGIELISPVMKIRDVLPILQSLFSFLDGLGCYTNESCGLHVTFGHPKLTSDFKYFDPLKFGVFMREDKLLARFGRTSNGYAVNLSNLIGSILKAEVESNNSPDGPKAYTPRTLDKYMSVPSAPGGPQATQENLAKLVQTQKFRQRVMPICHYTSISLSKLDSNLVEVRSMGGDYLDQSPKDIGMLVKHIARCLILSVSPRTAVDHYVSAVRRLLSVSKPIDAPAPARQVKIGADNVYLETPTEYTSNVFIRRLRGGHPRVSYVVENVRNSQVSCSVEGRSLLIQAMSSPSDKSTTVPVLKLLNLILDAYESDSKFPLLAKLTKTKANYEKLNQLFPEVTTKITSYFPDFTYLRQEIKEMDLTEEEYQRIISRLDDIQRRFG